MKYLICKKCEEEKALNMFYRNKNMDSGRESSCKVCRNLYNSQWRKDNPDKRKEILNKYYKKNKKQIIENKRVWCLNNIYKRRVVEKRCYDNNKHTLRLYRTNNKIKIEGKTYYKNTSHPLIADLIEFRKIKNGLKS